MADPPFDQGPSGGSSQGPATDAANVSVVDPTPNVLGLVDAANQRQDDLRELAQKHLRELLDLRTELWNQDYKRQDDLRDAEKEHGREVLRLRTELGDQGSACAAEIAEIRTSFQRRIDDIHTQHAEALRKAEAARIDAIREVDTEAVRQTAQVQATQQQALAATVTATAEAMRTQVAAATEAATQRLAVAVEPLQKAIEDLRRSQYEAQGQKTQVVERQAAGGTMGMWIGVAISGAVGFIGVIAAIVLAVTR